MNPTQLALVAAQLLALLVLPVVMLGLINRVKSFWAGRRGPGLLQPYADMRRLLRKEPVYSNVTTEMFRLGPVVALATSLVAGMLTPLLGPLSPLAFPLDFIAFAYVLGLGRVFEHVRHHRAQLLLVGVADVLPHHSVRQLDARRLHRRTAAGWSECIPLRGAVVRWPARICRHMLRRGGRCRNGLCAWRNRFLLLDGDTFPSLCLSRLKLLSKAGSK